jgi:hypothetical protein
MKKGIASHDAIPFSYIIEALLRLNDMLIKLIPPLPSSQIGHQFCSF